MRWWMHWGIQAVLARVPGGQTIHRHLQENFGQLKHLESGNQFENALEIIESAVSVIGSLPGVRVAEIGTGWVPAVPMALGLIGCEVHTFDVASLTNQDYFRRTLEAWEPRLAELAQAAQQSHDEVAKRWERLARTQSLAEFCSQTGGRCLAPVDTTCLPDSSGTFDLVVSNLVMQCVPEELIVPVLRESARLLKPAGWAIHRITMADEYATSDTERHRLHYLAYSRETWNRWFNHSLKVQNRWRASQFLDAFRDVGFVPHEVQKSIDQSGVDFFRQVPFAPEFAHLDEDDLATIGLKVVLRKPPLPHHLPSDCPSSLSPSQ